MNMIWMGSPSSPAKLSLAVVLTPEDLQGAAGTTEFLVWNAMSGSFDGASRKTSIGPREAREFSFKINPPGGPTMFYRFFIAVANGREYILHWETPWSEADKWQYVLDGILDSFRVGRDALKRPPERKDAGHQQR